MDILEQIKKEIEQSDWKKIIDKLDTNKKKKEEEDKEKR